MGDFQGSIPPIIAKIAPDGNLTPRQKRGILIEMSLRRQRLGTGSSLDFLMRRTAMNPWPDLRSILKGIPWVIIDGVATRAYMPERMTKDLDILIRKSDEDEVVKRLETAGFTRISKLAVPGYLFQAPDGAEVDVLIGDMPWISDALSRPNQDPTGYPVLDLPYLVLMKLDAMRAQDWADITRMLGLASEKELEEVKKIIARYSPEDAADLEALIFIGKKEQELPPSPE
jgi:hypothetical protein